MREKTQKGYTPIKWWFCFLKVYRAFIGAAIAMLGAHPAIQCPPAVWIGAFFVCFVLCVLMCGLRLRVY